MRKTILDKVLDKIKETISFTKFDDTKILIDTDVKFSDYIWLKDDMVLITCVIKADAKFYLQRFLGEALYNEQSP